MDADVYDGYYIPKGVLNIIPCPHAQKLTGVRCLHHLKPLVGLPSPHSSVDLVLTLHLLHRSMAHNECKYPRPFEFLPERFLNDDGTLKPDDTQNITFGFGRRICVGRHFADTSVWSAIATVLAVFTLSKARDEDGREVPVVPKFTSGLAVQVYLCLHAN